MLIYTYTHKTTHTQIGRWICMAVFVVVPTLHDTVACVLQLCNVEA